MPTVRTNRSYNRITDTELSNFTGNSITKLTGNPTFDKPPVPIAELTTLKTAFDDALVAAYKGGKLATALKNAARAAVVTALDKNASYVDINCKDDLAILLSSGYEAVSTNRAQRVLEAPQILAVEYGQSGELKARIKPDPNSKTFVGRIKEATGSEFGPSISFANSRSILFKGLKAGVPTSSSSARSVAAPARATGASLPPRWRCRSLDGSYGARRPGAEPNESCRRHACHYNDSTTMTATVETQSPFVSPGPRDAIPYRAEGFGKLPLCLAPTLDLDDAFPCSGVAVRRIPHIAPTPQRVRPFSSSEKRR